MKYTKQIKYITATLVLSAALILPISSLSAYSGGPNIFTGPDLTIGSTGAYVTELQGLLIETGYLSVPQGVALGYYGSLTQAAVARYQETLGVVPAAGYYGPITKAAMSSAYNAKGWLALLYR